MGIWDRLSRTLGELSEELLPGELRDRLDGARGLLDRGNAGAALAALDLVLKEQPEHATALYLRGEALRVLGRHAEAERALGAALAARPGLTEATAALGEVLLAKGDATGALIKLREALSSAGGDAALLGAIYRAMGAAHLALGAPDRALRELRKALAEDPAAPEIGPLLADALTRAGALDEEARAPLERALRAAGDKAPASVLLALGRLDRDAALLERALAAAPAAPPSRIAGEALLALGELAFVAGRHEAAHQRLEAAASHLSDDPRVTTLQAEVLVAAGNPSAALGLNERSFILRADVSERALRAALATGDPERIAPWATRLLDAHPAAAPFALAARGFALLLARELDAAARALDQAMAAGPTALAHVGLAVLARERGDLTSARRHVNIATGLDPREPLVRGAAQAVRAAELRLVPGASPAQTLAAWVAREPHLTALAGDVAHLLEAIERPLLVTVMGEFSAGKSTFVNAFLGASVAPTGITPTTATINILRLGRERAARIHYADDTTRDVAWADVPRTLSGLAAADAARIRHVDLFVPLEQLARVSIVDTPGLNSILPEHEETARRFIKEADAVLWLFTAGQAGKASEREALTRIQAEGKRVLGVLNKVDQLDAAAVSEVLLHLRNELGAGLEDLVPLSARQALAARTAATPDAAAFDASGWTALDATLEAKFFSRARELKAEATARRLGELVAAAKDKLKAPSTAAMRRAAALHAAAELLRTGTTTLLTRLADTERRRLAEGVATAYRTAARELLELVRPRRVPFGEHRATPADRDYLRGLLERALDRVLDDARDHVLVAVDGLLANARGAVAQLDDTAAATSLTQAIDAARRAALAEGLEHARGFVRGALRGGGLDLFFSRELPRAELTEDALTHALLRDAPAYELELLAPVRAAITAALSRLGDDLRAHAERASIVSQDLLMLDKALDHLAPSVRNPP